MKKNGVTIFGLILVVVVVLGLATGVYPKGFIWNALVTVALIQVLFWIFGALLFLFSKVLNKVRMQQCLTGVDEKIVVQAKEAIDLENDMSMANSLYDLIKELPREFQVGVRKYVLSNIAFKKGCFSLKEAEQKSMDTGEYRFSLLVLSCYGGMVKIAQDNKGKRYALYLDIDSSQILLCPLVDDGTGRILLGKPVQKQESSNINIIDKIPVDRFLREVTVSA